MRRWASGALCRAMRTQPTWTWGRTVRLPARAACKACQHRDMTVPQLRCARACSIGCNHGRNLPGLGRSCTRSRGSCCMRRRLRGCATVACPAGLAVMGDATFRHIYAGGDTTSDAAATLGAAALLAADATDDGMFAALRAGGASADAAAAEEPVQHQQGEAAKEKGPRQGPGGACIAPPFLDKYVLGQHEHRPQSGHVRTFALGQQGSCDGGDMHCMRATGRRRRSLIQPGSGSFPWGCLRWGAPTRRPACCTSPLAWADVRRTRLWTCSSLTAAVGLTCMPLHLS